MQLLALILLCSSISVSVSLPVHLATQPGRLAPKVVKRGGESQAAGGPVEESGSAIKNVDGVANSVRPRPNAIPDLRSMSNNNLPKFDVNAGTAGRTETDELDELPLTLNRQPPVKFNENPGGGQVRDFDSNAGKGSQPPSNQQVEESNNLEGATQAGAPVNGGDRLKVETTAGRESVDANPNGNLNPPKEGEVKVEEAKQLNRRRTRKFKLSPVQAGLTGLGLALAGTIGAVIWHEVDEKSFDATVDSFVAWFEHFPDHMT